MKYPLETLPQLAASKRRTFKQKLKSLKKMPTKEVDREIHQLHEKAFARINCLNCANCCKTTGPLFVPSDIARISKKLGIKQKQFKQAYLRIDEDGDVVLQSLPCPFLLEDNTCSIYDIAPKACREYPHTDMVGQQKIFDLTIRNAAICPGVMEILDEL
ncbi:MAG: YkgJ family cysteine cluster protein [Bacteroidia bacterium]|nr:YkgJ family cysteine cluster protein [Bacteroidia bacterium]